MESRSSQGTTLVARRTADLGDKGFRHPAAETPHRPGPVSWLPSHGRIAAPTCTLCGRRVAMAGFDLVVGSARALVCERCGLRYAPQLVATLRDDDAAQPQPCPR